MRFNFSTDKFDYGEPLEVYMRSLGRTMYLDDMRASERFSDMLSRFSQVIYQLQQKYSSDIVLDAAFNASVIEAAKTTVLGAIAYPDIVETYAFKSLFNHVMYQHDDSNYDATVDAISKMITNYIEVEKPATYTRSNGEVVNVEDMATPHIYNALRKMLRSNSTHEMKQLFSTIDVLPNIHLDAKALLLLNNVSVGELKGEEVVLYNELHARYNA